MKSLLSPHLFTTQGESVSFLEASERVLFLGEVLVGYIEKDSGSTVCNPPDKEARIISREVAESLVTVAFGGGKPQPWDWDGT